MGTPAYPNATTQFGSERALWVNHPRYFFFLDSQVTKQVALIERDIVAPYNPPSRDKDNSDTEFQSPTCTAAQLESDERKSTKANQESHWR